MKITMLGKSGSGKTSYMAGLHARLVGSSTQDFTIQKSATSLIDAIYGISDLERISFTATNISFPHSTIQSTVWHFDLCHLDRIVCNFEWIDYRGGIIDDVVDPTSLGDPARRKEIDEIIGHIALSNAVMVFVDSVLLTHYKTPGERRHHSGANVITSILQRYSQWVVGRNTTIVIVLTKADSDLISSNWKEDNYRELVNCGRETFEGLSRICRRNEGLWRSGIVAVGAVGNGNVTSVKTLPNDFRVKPSIEATISGFPNPTNVEIPLFFCLSETLKTMSQLARFKSEQIEAMISQELERSSSVRDFWRTVTGRATTAEMVSDWRAAFEKERDSLYKISGYITPLLNASISGIRSL